MIPTNSIRPNLASLTRLYQPGKLPAPLATSGVLSLGVAIGPSAYQLQSPGADVSLQGNDVKVVGPTAKVREEALASLRHGGWHVMEPDPAAAYNDYHVIPPPAFKTATPDAVTTSTVQALVALSRLMPPGMPTARKVQIFNGHLPDRVREQMAAIVRESEGLGLGAVNLEGPRQTRHIGTAVPIFVGARLLTNPGAYPILADTLLNYMVAVMAGGSAAPYAFHVIAQADPHGSTTPPDISDAQARLLLKIVAGDRRLASGSWRGFMASQAASAALLIGGLYATVWRDGPQTPSEALVPLSCLLAGSLAMAVTVAVGRHRDRQSRTAPAITTPCSLTIWRGNQPSATLHRTSYRPRAMRTYMT